MLADFGLDPAATLSSMSFARYLRMIDGLQKRHSPNINQIKGEYTPMSEREYWQGVSRLQEMLNPVHKEV